MTVLEVDASQVLLDARCRLIQHNAWLGTFASHFTWVPDANIRTLGVMMKTLSRIECRYSPEFILKLSIDSNMAAVEHELMHVILMHLMRCGSRNHRLWNIATDMVINGKYEDPHIKFLKDIEDEAAEVQEDGTKAPFKLIWYPEHWPSLSSEEVYERLEQCRIVVKQTSACGTCGGTGQSGDDGQGSDGQGSDGQGSDGQGRSCPSCGGSGKGQTKPKVIHDGGGGETIVVPGSTLDDHNTWNECEITEDQARQMVKDMCEQTTSQVGVGSVPGNILSALKNLNEAKRNWKNELRHIVGRKYGGKRRTYARQNRRRPAFGTKGKSSHASAPLTVATDTSGSVDKPRLEQFFSEIEAMSQRFKIDLMQFDCNYQCHGRYHRGDWRNIEIKGRGGTSFIKAFEALDEYDLWGKLTIILTDGDAAWPEKPDHDVLWVILPHRTPPPEPPFGDVIYIER